MNTVDILTAQNVRITFETAGLPLRVFAFLTDLIIMGGVFGLYVLLLTSFDAEHSDLLLQLGAFLWFGFYSLFSEFFGNGQSPGKRALGIQVIKLSGDELDFFDCFSRWSTRLFEIYLSLGSIAAIFIAGKHKGQRLGDLLAGTCLIRKHSSSGFRLKDILRLNAMQKDTYHFTYPQAEKLHEKDVIRIKTLLRRKNRYPNKAHEEATEALCIKLKDLLGLAEIPENRELFLNTLVSDYIIISR